MYVVLFARAHGSRCARDLDRQTHNAAVIPILIIGRCPAPPLTESRVREISLRRVPANRAGLIQRVRR